VTPPLRERIREADDQKEVTVLALFGAAMDFQTDGCLVRTDTGAGVTGCGETAVEGLPDRWESVPSSG